MFLSVGFVFGIAFYGCAFYIFRKSALGKQALFWPLIALLAIAETKEGMMFAGYSSRLLFILMGFWAAERLNAKRINKRNPTVARATASSNENFPHYYRFE